MLPTLLLSAALWASSTTVQAQDSAVDVATPRQPERLVGAWTVGAPLRLVRDVDFDQDRIAPLYTDVLLGYTAASSIRLRHGLGVGASLNITEEGGFTQPVPSGGQLTLMPAYLLFYDLGPDYLGLGHVGVPLNIAGGTSVGLELAAGLAHRLRAGLGVFGELGLNVFPGADSTMHGTLSFELGLLIDYEVLP